MRLIGLLNPRPRRHRCDGWASRDARGPYWIVARSFANPDYAQTQYEAIRLASAAVSRCGLQPFNDFSGKFAGFSAGFDVVGGGYADRASAEPDLVRLRLCVPGATVRPGRYLGE